MAHQFLLHHLLTQSASRRPNNTAVIYKDSSLTYAELDQRSSQLAASLQKAGVQPGDRIGIMAGKSLEAIIALFGILKAGGVYVPVDAGAPRTRIDRILESCAISVIVSTAASLKLIDGDAGANATVQKVLLTDASAWKPQKPPPWEIIAWPRTHDADFPNAVQKISDVDAAYILHTSGSTGIPKGVAISHRNALTFIEMAADYFAVHAGDRLCNHAPLHFDLSVFDIFVAIKTGAAVVLAPEFLSVFPAKLAEFIAGQRITVWNSVASALVMLVDRGRLDRFSFDTMRLIHFSGDVLPPKYIGMLKKSMPAAALYNIYGQTEANSSLCYRVDSVPPDADWKIPLGKALPNFDVFALDERGAPIARPGQEGELYIKGSTVALGYWNDETRTRERFMPDPRNPLPGALVYKTGDIVRLDADGNFLFAGRKDHMIKSRGYRIELGEIESVLARHGAIKVAAALALPNSAIGNRIVACVLLNEHSAIGEKELLDHCAEALPQYMVPESIDCRESMPTLSTGKIDRHALTAYYLNAAPRSNPAE